MSTIEDIRKEMTRGTPLSSKEASHLLVRLASEIGRVNTRWSAIAIAGPRSNNHGPIYKKALTTGTNDEVAALQHEFDNLCIERDRLKATHDELHRIRSTMAVKEASAGLPALQEKLEASIKLAEDNQRELERSFDALQDAYTAVVQARSLAQSAGLTITGAKPDVVQRLIALSPLSSRSRTALHWRPDVHSDNLGTTPGEVGRSDSQTASHGRWLA